MEEIEKVANTSTMSIYGGDMELQQMATRYRNTLPNGKALHISELVALAQLERMTGLHAHTKEIWFIPQVGAYIGIAGMLRLWNEQFSDGWSNIQIDACGSEEAGATEDEIAKGVIAAAFRVELTSGTQLREYQKTFLETARSLKEIGHPNPHAGALEICGKKPSWEGWGYSTTTEKSRMNKTQLARKRATMDALKKCVKIPAGVNASIEYVDAVTTEVEEVTEEIGYKKTPEQMLNELMGVHTPDQIMGVLNKIPETVEEIERVDAALKSAQ